MVTYKNCLLTFGGLGACSFNDVHEFPIYGNKWKKVEIKSFDYDKPNPRYGHSMVLYKDLLVIYGGAGNYIDKLKVHESYGDIRFYNIISQEWEPSRVDQTPSKLAAPKSQFHQAGTFGCMMLIHGGMFSEQ